MARTETPRAWTDSVERPIALDPRSPYALDTHELGRRPGTMRTVQLTVPAPEDLGTVVIGVPAGSDLDLDFRLEAVMEGVLVSGAVRGRAVGECGRCRAGAVEVRRRDPHDVPALQGAEAAARGVPGMRYLHRAAVQRGAPLGARDPLTAARQPVRP